MILYHFFTAHPSQNYIIILMYFLLQVLQQYNLSRETARPRRCFIRTHTQFEDEIMIARYFVL